MGRPRKKKTKIDNDSSLDTNTDPIPTDIVSEILQRLPSKSVTKFVRVSKSWAKIIRSNYFINSFMEFQTKQPHRQLFVFNEFCDLNWSFFSSSSDEKRPQVEYLSRIVSTFDGYPCSPIYVKGLVNFKFGTTQVISNPSTGTALVLPHVKTPRKKLGRYFGFDPIKTKYKVLCITYDSICRPITSDHYQVLTVGSKSNLWREIEFWIPHLPISEGICIDGIIYYLAYETSEVILVRFDVSSEKFLKKLSCSFIEGLSYTLLNYESKLAIGHKTNDHPIDLWVLEDSEKPKWSKISHDVSQWKSLINGFGFEILGTIPSGEIVYICYGKRDSSYVIYQDQKKNQHRIVQIKAEKDCNSTSVVKVNGFIDYEESVMLL